MLVGDPADAAWRAGDWSSSLLTSMSLRAAKLPSESPGRCWEVRRCRQRGRVQRHRPTPNARTVDAGASRSVESSGLPAPPGFERGAATGSRLYRRCRAVRSPNRPQNPSQRGAPSPELTLVRRFPGGASPPIPALGLRIPPIPEGASDQWRPQGAGETRPAGGQTRLSGGGQGAGGLRHTTAEGIEAENANRQRINCPIR